MSRGRPFEKGNKFGRGRPPGSRNRRTIAAQEMVEAYSEPLQRKGLAMALQGDRVLLCRYLDRLSPKSNSAPVKLARLPTTTIEEVARYQQYVLDQVASGKVNPAQGLQLIEMSEKRRKVIEDCDLAKKLEELEQRIGSPAEKQNRYNDTAAAREKREGRQD
jgi:hypothetical protein